MTKGGTRSHGQIRLIRDCAEATGSSVFTVAASPPTRTETVKVHWPATGRSTIADCASVFDGCGLRGPGAPLRDEWGPRLEEDVNHRVSQHRASARLHDDAHLDGAGTQRLGGGENADGERTRLLVRAQQPAIGQHVGSKGQSSQRHRECDGATPE